LTLDRILGAYLE